jgi:hypothetical protein
MRSRFRSSTPALQGKHRRSPLPRVPALLLSALLVLAGTVAAQQTPTEGVPSPGEERFPVFVQAHVEIERIRDELQVELARWHETDRRLEVRREGDERIARVLESHGIHPEVFHGFTRLISTDQAARDAFEELAVPLREGRP